MIETASGIGYSVVNSHVSSNLWLSMPKCMSFALICLFATFSTCTNAGQREWKTDFDAGVAAFKQADFKNALPRFQSAVREAEQFGDRDIRLAHTLGWLAVTYESLGNYSGAEPVHVRALSIY